MQNELAPCTFKPKIIRNYKTVTRPSNKQETDIEVFE
jgi:hypothetical protein